MPSTQTVYNYTQENLPEWYSGYLSNLLGRGQALIDQRPNAPTYSAARTAGFVPDQAMAYNAIRDMQGDYQPMLDDAGNLLTEAGASNTLDVLRPGFARMDAAGNVSTANQLMPYMQSAQRAGMGEYDAARGFYDSGARDTASLFDPYATEASGLARGAASGTTYGLGAPFIQSAAGMSGLGTALPWLSAASQRFPDMAGDYMNPFTSGVTDEIARLGARNLNEYLLPGISDQFVRAGQFGSAQQRDVVGRALRDTQESVLGEQRRALESGYNTAGQLFNQDQSRLGGLAGTVGGLTGQQQQTLLGAGTSLAGLGGSDLERQLAGAGVLSNIGQFRTSAEAADAARALQAGEGMRGIGAELGGRAVNIAGLQGQMLTADAARRLQAATSSTELARGAYAADMDRRISASAGQAGLAQTGQQLGLQGAAALENIGATQQGLNQRGLDLAYGDWQQQQNWPQQQLDWYSNLVRGHQTGGSTTSQQTQPGPSTLSQVAGVGLGVAGLANSGIFKAKGGAVKATRYRKSSHSYGNVPRRGVSFPVAA